MGLSFAYALWIACTLLEILACVLIIVRGQLRQHFALWSYLALCCVVSGFRWHFLSAYGLVSREYLYAYCLSDLILNVALYLAVLEPYRKLFQGPGARLAVRLANFGGPILVLFLSVLGVSSGRSLFGRLIDLSQNFLLLGALFSLVLFHPRLWDRRVPVHVYQLIFAVAAYFTFLISVYASRQLLSPPRRLPYAWTELGGLLLPLGVVYVFSNHATSRARPQIWL